MRVLLLLALAPAFCHGQQTCTADGAVVNSVTGEPIPRARVAARGDSAGAIADGTGHWTISNLTCGPITIAASKPGFLPTSVTATDVPAHDMRVELIPQAVITGKVLDDEGDPVPNARVNVLSSRVLEGRRAFLQSSGATTNDLGEFRIASLPAGNVILCASAQTFDAMNPVVLGESCYPGPVDGGAASALALFAGREARVDFNLTRIPTVRIRGKLAGLPEGSNGAVALARQGTQTRTAPVARDGLFEIRGVPSGSYTLSVDYWESGKRLLARMPIEVGAVDIDGVVLHVDPGITVTGTVSGAPKQINVSLRGADPALGAGAPQWDKTRTAFTIGDAAPGSYMLTVSVPPPYYVKSAMLGGRDMLREAVPLLQSAGPVEVLIGDDAGSLQGQIQDFNGDPVRGWVFLWREGRPPIQAPGGTDGRFKIAGLAPGDYIVYAWDDIQRVEYANPEWMRRNAGPGIAVTVTAGQAVDIKPTRAVAPRE